MKLLAVLVLVTACHPFISAGYDANPKIGGKLASMVTPTARTADGTAVAPSATAPSYAFALGGGTRDFTVALGVQTHEIASQVLAPTASLDFTANLFRFHGATLAMHAGPGAGALLDMGTLQYGFGQGYRAGGTFGLSLGPAMIFVDVSRTGILFMDGPAQGASDFTGATFGLALH